MPWEALLGSGNCCPTFHQGFIGLLGVYTMVTQIISEQNLDFFSELTVSVLNYDLSLQC